MSAQGLTDYEYAHKRLHYDAETGVFRWKEVCSNIIPDNRVRKIWNTKYAGTVAGKSGENGRKTISVLWFDGSTKWIKLHRIAWLMVYGEWPKGVIDHINGDPSDNRMCNLRDVTERSNQTNRRYVGGKSGIYGVTWSKHHKKWLVRISDMNKKQIYLGYYDNIDDAIAVRKQAELRYGYHKNHGR